jgi:hypothetical protein
MKEQKELIEKQGYKYDEDLYNILNRFYSDETYTALNAIKAIKKHFESSLNESDVPSEYYKRVEIKSEVTLRMILWLFWMRKIISLKD